MGKNIFVSYKYADESVQHLYGCWPTTVRHYVDELINKLDKTDHIYRGEGTDEDLSYLSDDAIYERLKDKIYNTTVTIVLISPNMKLEHRKDKSQWIPWEVYYSLRETTRNGRTSHRNSIIAVVLPDTNGSYDYMIENQNCCTSGCRLLHTDKLFNILQYNMFNRKSDNGIKCNTGSIIHYGHSSYIHMVKWEDFINNIDVHVAISEEIRDNIDDYDIHLSVNAK